MRRLRLTNRLGNFEVLTDSDRYRIEALHRAGPKPVVEGKGWYRIKNLTERGAGHVEVYMYDEIGLWGITAADFVRELNEVSAVQIDLRINSPGGDVWDGIAIYNALCNHPASVTSYVDGLAASAASFIAQAGGKVCIARNGTMMIHDAEGICIGNASDMLEMAGLLDKASDNIADIYAQRCSTVLQWRKAMKAVSWYVGQEAVDSGLADETYEPEQGSDDQPAERRRKATNTHVGNEHTGPEATAPHPDIAPEVVPVPVSLVPGQPASDDDLSWWDPDLFRVAVATAADQNKLYDFDADAFREAMRTAIENCPAPRETEVAVTTPTVPEPSTSGAEFLSAIRRGLL